MQGLDLTFSFLVTRIGYSYPKRTKTTMYMMTIASAYQIQKLGGIDFLHIPHEAYSFFDRL